MTGYDFERPFISADKLTLYRANDPEVAQRYGKQVKVTEMSNVEYKQRFERLSTKQSMKPPPSTGRTFHGYLVIQHLGRADAYETWIPDNGLEGSYEPIANGKPVRHVRHIRYLNNEEGRTTMAQAVSDRWFS